MWLIQPFINFKNIYKIKYEHVKNWIRISENLIDRH